MSPPVYVRSDGCIRLGNKVTCDGFAADVPIRIQTHVHQDHMKDFNRSKGSQKRIVMSKATFELLVAEYGGDLPYRTSQIICLPVNGEFYDVEGIRIALFSSGHMLGGVMPVVQEDSMQYAYTSDFSWPLLSVPINVHTLVVDATYGSPENQRNYCQEEVIDNFIATVQDALGHGSVIISGHRGRLQFAIGMLSASFRVPFLLSDAVAKTIDVHARYSGLQLDRICQINSAQGRAILGGKQRFIGFTEPRDHQASLLNADATRILLSAFMVPKEDPVLVHRNGLIRIALTDHADFSGTVELIKAVQPEYVIADGSRGGNADALANFVMNELKLPATSEERPVGLDWGT